MYRCIDVDVCVCVCAAACVYVCASRLNSTPTSEEGGEVSVVLAALLTFDRPISKTNRPHPPMLLVEFSPPQTSIDRCVNVCGCAIYVCVIDSNACAICKICVYIHRHVYMRRRHKCPLLILLLLTFLLLHRK